jgi:hypothetical protein
MKKCYSCGKDLNGSLYKHTIVPTVYQHDIIPFVKKNIRPDRVTVSGVVIKEYCNVKCYSEE